jgi:hypothetical protein
VKPERGRKIQRPMSRLIPIAVLASACAFTPVADADELPSLPQSWEQPETPSCFSSPLAFVMASPEECALAWNGITFYGRIDVGVTHDTHGVPFNGAYPNGVETQISKNSNRSLTSIAPNGLCESFLGLKGVEPIGASDWSLIFNAQTGFDPYSLSMLRPVRPTQKRTTPGSPRRAPRRRRRRGSSGRRRRTAYGGHIPGRFAGDLTEDRARVLYAVQQPFHRALLTGRTRTQSGVRNRASMRSRPRIARSTPISSASWRSVWARPRSRFGRAKSRLYPIRRRSPSLS